MTFTSNVPKIEFTSTGITLPTLPEIFYGVQSDINDSFGGGLNDALETPQGQLASSQTAIINDKNNEIANIINQIDPLYSDGRFQDAIGRLYFLRRKESNPTVVVCTLNGLPGTTIPLGAKAKDTNGNVYACDETVVIGNNSSVTASFSNVVNGPIACPANSLITVWQTVIGWDSINNPSDGVLGNDVESRGDFEYRRKNSVALNAHSSLSSIYSAVFNINDVLDVYAYENNTGDTKLIGSTLYSMKPHSIYIAVVGGLDSDIANTIFNKKSIGCDYNGNTDIIVTDTNGYNAPYPKYTVKFCRPDPINIYFKINIIENPYLPIDITDIVKIAIVNRFNGVNGIGKERIGSIISVSKYYGAILNVIPDVSIDSIYIGTNSTPTDIQILIGIDQYPAISANNITVNLIQYE